MKKFLLILLSVMTLFITTVPVFAAETNDYYFTYRVDGYTGGWSMPTPPLVSGYDYMVMALSDNNSGNTFTFVASTVPMYKASSSGGSGINFDGDGSYYIVTASRDTKVWSAIEYKTANDGGVALVKSNFPFWANYDLLRYDGQLVITGDTNFQTPPTVMEVVTEEMETTTLPKIMDSFSILTLCGVGLIALLVGLVLFGKVLRRYLPS